MARTAHRETQLSTKSSRSESKKGPKKLLPRKKPYYTNIMPGLLLGYIKRPGGAAGAWVSRKQLGYSETGAPRHQIKTLGLADDLDRADGVRVLSYEQARAKAGDAAAQPSALTVREAVRRYTENIRSLRGDSAAEDALTKLRPHVLAEKTDGTPRKGHTGLGDVLVVDLKLPQLIAWRDGLVRRDPKDPDAERRSQDTANRCITSFKAAMNAAVKEDEANGVDIRTAWRLLDKFPGVARPREGHFSEDDVLLLLRTAREQDPFLADMLEGAAHTGSRPPKDLAQLDVKDFKEQLGPKGQHIYTIDIHKGKTKARTTYLTSEGAAFFRRVAEGKKPDDVLLPKADGARWGKSDQTRPMKQVLDTAGLSGCMYLLRHSYVRRARADGVPDYAIAENCGTSIKMIEQTYGKRDAPEQSALIQRMGSLMAAA